MASPFFVGAAFVRTGFVGAGFVGAAFVGAGFVGAGLPAMAAHRPALTPIAAKAAPTRDGSSSP